MREDLPAPTRPHTATSSPGLAVNSGTFREKGVSDLACLNSASRCKSYGWGQVDG